MTRGGRRSTTWDSTWNLGKTKTIRIPIAISQELIQIARRIDEGNLDLIAGYKAKLVLLMLCYKTK